MLRASYRRLGPVWALLLVVSLGGAAPARADCTVLAEARERYIIGRFDETIEMIEGCIAEQSLSQQQMHRAYPLLVQAYLAKQARAEAIAAVERLLKLMPGYEPDPINDPPPFCKLVLMVKGRQSQAAPARPPDPIKVPGIDDPDPDYSEFDPPIPLVYFEVQETNLGQEVVVSRLDSQLKRALLFEGFAIIKDTRNADYLIQLRAVTRQGIEFYGKHTAFADLRLTLSDHKTGIELYETTLLDVTGTHVDFPNAGLDALEKAAFQLRIKHLDDLLAHMREGVEEE